MGQWNLPPPPAAITFTIGIPCEATATPVATPIDATTLVATATPVVTTTPVAAAIAVATATPVLFSDSGCYNDTGRQHTRDIHG